VDLEKEREVTEEMGNTLARELNIPFFETSSKTEVNVDTAFVELGKLMYKRLEAETPRVKESPSLIDISSSGPPTNKKQLFKRCVVL